MSEQPKKPNPILIVITLIVLLAAVGYVYYFDKPIVEETPRVVTPSTNESTQSANEDQDTSINEDEQLPDANDDPMIDFTSWETVKGEGYEFKHPNYFIRDNGDHYIMAYEPRVGQEFAALAIFKPTDIKDPIADMKKYIADSDASVGVKVIKEPQKVMLDGFKSAYAMEYELESGYNTGKNKFFILQSPYTDKFVTIEYAVNPNAESIKDSFKFTEE